MKPGDIGSNSKVCVSNVFFLLKKYQSSNYWTFLEKQLGFSEKNAWIFFSKWLTWHIWYTICLKLGFYSRILQTFSIWLFSEKCLEFFKNAKNRKIFQNASQTVLKLRSSQNVQNLEFLEQKMFFFRKKAWFFRKIANFVNFFIECILNCIIAQEFSKLSKLIFYLGKKMVCSKKILGSFQKQ